MVTRPFAGDDSGTAAQECGLGGGEIVVVSDACVPLMGGEV